MVTMLQVYKTSRYLLVERCLCIVQACRFLSPPVMIKMLSNAKYMVTFILMNVRFRVLLTYEKPVALELFSGIVCGGDCPLGCSSPALYTSILQPINILKFYRLVTL